MKLRHPKATAILSLFLVLGILTVFFHERLFFAILQRSLKAASSKEWILTPEAASFQEMSFSVFFPKYGVRIPKIKARYSFESILPPKLKFFINYSADKLELFNCTLFHPSAKAYLSFVSPGSPKIDFLTETTELVCDKKPLVSLLKLSGNLHETEPDTYAAEISAQGEKFSLLAPFHLDIGVQAKKSTDLLKAGIKLKFHDLPVEGTGDFLSNTKETSLNLDIPFSFSKDLQPSELVPVLEDLENVTGELKLGFTFNKKTDLKSSLRMRVKTQGMSALFYKIPFSNIRTDFTLQFLPFLMTPGNPTIRLDKIGSDFNFKSVVLMGSLQKDSGYVKKAEADMEGGKLTVIPFKFNLKSKEFQTAILLNSVDLKELVTLVNSERMAGAGKLQGNIPLSYQKKFLTIKNAHLWNDNPGMIQYLDDSIELVSKKIDTLQDFNNLIAMGQQALVFKALQNFHYSRFNLVADRTPSTGLSLKFELKGKNPDLANGQVFDLNLPVTGDVEPFIMDGISSSFMEK